VIQRMVELGADAGSFQCPELGAAFIGGLA
jgi:hypothetical protein